MPFLRREHTHAHVALISIRMKFCFHLGFLSLFNEKFHAVHIDGISPKIYTSVFAK